MFNESVAPSTTTTTAATVTTAAAAATTTATAVTDVKRKTDNYAAAKFVAPCQFYKTLVNCQAYMASVSPSSELQMASNQPTN